MTKLRGTEARELIVLGMQPRVLELGWKRLPNVWMLLRASCSAGECI